MNCRIHLFTGSTGKKCDDFNDIWNVSEPKYEDFALDDSVTSFKNSTGNQVDSISPTPKQRCSLTDINRQLSSSNVTLRKHHVTSLSCSIRSKEILDQLNAALNSKETQFAVEATGSSPTNISPVKNNSIVLYDQHSACCNKALSSIKLVVFMIFMLVFLTLFIMALAWPSPIFLSEEISECFHKGESHISFKGFLLELVNPHNQCSFFKLCYSYYNSLMGLI